VVAGLATGFDLPEAIRHGAAAAAMQVGGMNHQGCWDELRDFAAKTPLRPVRPKRRIRPRVQLTEGLKLAGSAAAGAAAASITILLATMAAT
jgi:sugar/nucleoside kinase (ribokinase family)